MKADAEDAHHQLVDVLSNYDDVIMEKYLESEEITAEDLHRALRAATSRARSSGAVRLGVQEQGRPAMLDAVVDYLPSRSTCPHPGHGPGQGRGTRADLRRRRALLSPRFKVMTDPYVGKLTYLRVYSGRCARAAR